MLLVTGVLLTRKSSRRLLDRVSFRLLAASQVMALIVNVLVLCNVVAVHGNDLSTCQVVSVLQNALISVSNYLLMFVGVNLLLVVVFQVRAEHCRMREMTYYGLSFGLPCLTFAGVIGMGVILHRNDKDFCYVPQQNRHWTYMLVSLNTAYGNLLLATGIALCSSIWTVVWLHLEIRKLQHAVRELGSEENRAVNTELYARRIGHMQLRKITFRILLYPLLMVLINVSNAILERMWLKYGRKHETPLAILFNIVDVAGGGVLGILLLFFDPSLKRSSHTFCAEVKPMVAGWLKCARKSLSMLFRRYLDIGPTPVMGPSPQPSALISFASSILHVAHLDRNSIAAGSDTPTIRRSSFESVSASTRVITVDSLDDDLIRRL